MKQLIDKIREVDTHIARLTELRSLLAQALDALDSADQLLVHGPSKPLSLPSAIDRVIALEWKTVKQITDEVVAAAQTKPKLKVHRQSVRTALHRVRESMGWEGREFGAIIKYRRAARPEVVGEVSISNEN